MLNLAQIGNKLKYFREKFGFSQEFVSRELGVNRQAVIAIENGRRKIDSFELFKLLDLYKLDLKELVEGSKENSQPSMRKCFALRKGGSLDDDAKKSLFEFQKICEDYEFLKNLK